MKNNSDIMVPVTCPKCSATFEVSHRAADAQGTYHTRCRFCGNRIIKHATSEVETPSASATLQSEYDSKHFDSIRDYEKWNSDIIGMIAKVKKTLYVRPLGKYDLSIGDMGESPQFAIFSPLSWWEVFCYWASGFNPPITIKSHRLLLERKLALINKYMDSAHPAVQSLMKLDKSCIEEILSIMRKARAKMREKYPGYPLEFETRPHEHFATQITIWLVLAGILFPPNLIFFFKSDFGLDLSPVFNFIPQMVVPAFSKMAAANRNPDSILIFLSTCFYLVIPLTLVQYYYPRLKMVYCRKIYITDLYIKIPILLLAIVVIYFAPLPWFSLFNARTTEWTAILIKCGGAYVAIVMSETLSSIAFMLKNRSTNIQEKGIYRGK